jgi:O-antigen ligase
MSRGADLAESAIEALNGPIESARAGRRAEASLSSTPLETVFTILVVTFPLIGTFFPLEGYLAAQSFAVQTAQASSESSLSSSTFVFGLLLVSYSWLSVVHWRVVLPGFMRNWPLLAFTLYTLASSTWAAAPGISLNRGGRMAIMVIVAVYLTQRYSTKDLVRLFTISFLISACLSVAVVALAPSLGMSALNGYSDAWRGALTHKNALGGAAAAGLVFSIYSSRIRANPRIALPTTMLLLFLLAMARSATASIAAIGTAVAAIYLMQLARVRRPIEKLFVAMIGLLLLAVGASGFYFADDLLALVGRDASFTGRASVWAAVQIAIDQRPIWGYGHGFWVSSSPMLSEIVNYLNWGVPEAHNTWLDIRLQLGAVGLAIAIGLWLVAGTNAALSLLFTKEGEALLWAALLVAIFLRGFSETLFVDPGIGGMFWFSLGYAGLARLAGRDRLVASGSIQQASLLEGDPRR